MKEFPVPPQLCIIHTSHTKRNTHGSEAVYSSYFLQIAQASLSNNITFHRPSRQIIFQEALHTMIAIHNIQGVPGELEN